MVNIGGFFASLKLVTDENSFQKGIGTLGKFPGLLKSGVAGAVGLGAAMVTLATTTAAAMTKLDAQARTLGISARTLDNWRGAVALAGGDADSFVESMTNMNEAFRNLKIGEVKQDFLTATGMSGANFAALQGMNNDQRLRTIWSALERVGDKDKQQALIEKIFGASGVQLFSLLSAKGQTLAGNYAQAAAINPMSSADYRAAIEGDKAQREIAQSLEKNFQNIGIEIEKALLPSLKEFAKWLVTHKQDLADFASAIGTATTMIIRLVGIVGDALGGFGLFKFIDSSQSSLKLESIADKLGVSPENKTFKNLIAEMGIKEGSFGGANIFLPTLWKSVTTSGTLPGFENAPAVSGLSGLLSANGASLNNVGAFAEYAKAIEKNAALSVSQKYEAEKSLFDKISAKPNVNLSVNIDKSGNVTVTDKDTGKVLESVRGGISYGQNGSLLK